MHAVIDNHGDVREPSYSFPPIWLLLGALNHGVSSTVVLQILSEVDGRHATGADLFLDGVAVGEGGREPGGELGHIKGKDAVWLVGTRARKPPVTKPTVKSGGHTEVRATCWISNDQHLNDLASLY